MRSRKNVALVMLATYFLLSWPVYAEVDQGLSLVPKFGLYPLFLTGSVSDAYGQLNAGSVLGPGFGMGIELIRPVNNSLDISGEISYIRNYFDNIPLTSYIIGTSGIYYFNNRREDHFRPFAGGGIFYSMYGANYQNYTPSGSGLGFKFFGGFDLGQFFLKMQYMSNPINASMLGFSASGQLSGFNIESGVKLRL